MTEYKFEYNAFCESKKCKYLQKWSFGLAFNGNGYNCKLTDKDSWDIYKLAKQCIHKEEAQQWKMWELLKNV